MAKGGGKGGRGGNPQGNGRGGGQQGGGQQTKYCRICNKNGHTTQDCYHNNNKDKNKHTGANGRGNGQQQQSGKFCDYCSRKSHTTEDCRTNPANNNQNQVQIQPQYPYQVQGYTGYQTPQVPDYNGKPIVFNDPCQLCTQRGHFARDCPTSQQFIPPQAGTYVPQTYPPPSAIPAPYQPPQNLWQQPQPQMHGYYSQGAMELISEEVSTRPPPTPQFRYVLEPSHCGQLGGYHGYLGCIHEMAYERARIMDKDGDFIMVDA